MRTRTGRSSSRSKLAWYATVSTLLEARPIHGRRRIRPTRTRHVDELSELGRVGVVDRHRSAEPA